MNHVTHDGLPIVKEINGWKVADGSTTDGPQHDNPEAAATWWLELTTIGELSDDYDTRRKN